MIAHQSIHHGIDPQVASPALHDRAELIRRKSRSLPGEDGHAHAIEARQPVQRGYPEISVGRLSDTANLVFRQAIVYRPDFKPILSLSRINSEEQNRQPCKQERDAREISKT